jgi:hypothetical protein
MMKYILFATILLVLLPIVTIAQHEDCPQIVEKALLETASHCNEVGDSEVCFGHGDTSVVVNCETVPKFDSPGDVVALDSVCALRLGKLQSSGEWGIAKMQVRATDADQSMTYVLFGDVEIQNAGSSHIEQRVWVEQTTEIHSGPGSHYSIMETLAADKVVYTNGCNCTGNWLRIRLDDGRVGWILSRDVSILGDASALPEVKIDTPVYAAMQAFHFRSGSSSPSCAEAPENGILIQTPLGTDEARLQINGVEVALNATIFAQSQPGDSLMIEVLEGVARVTIADFTAVVPAGARAVIAISEDNIPAGEMRVEPYARKDVAALPVILLPRPVDAISFLDTVTPSIVGVETCAVVSDTGEFICPVHFINPDGDVITNMNVEFVYAPQGEWMGSRVKQPELLDGDSVSGRLAWPVSCSLGSANFIGPIRWSITLTDETGHVSQPYEAAFNCVAG